MAVAIEYRPTLTRGQMEAVKRAVGRILDPTTGLGTVDIANLAGALERLVQAPQTATAGEVADERRADLAAAFEEGLNCRESKRNAGEAFERFMRSRPLARKVDAATRGRLSLSHYDDEGRPRP